jgi:hypothetical protein
MKRPRQILLRSWKRLAALSVALAIGSRSYTGVLNACLSTHSLAQKLPRPDNKGWRDAICERRCAPICRRSLDPAVLGANAAGGKLEYWVGRNLRLSTSRTTRSANSDWQDTLAVISQTELSN